MSDQMLRWIVDAAVLVAVVWLHWPPQSLIGS